jgi:hypothetical protein
MDEFGGAALFDYRVRMSSLATGGYDHPEAALKNARDARSLFDAGRFDGAYYLSGYVVESVIKSIYLVDQTFDRATGTIDPVKLATESKTLAKRPFGHEVRAILLAVGSFGASYVPFPPEADLIQDWHPTIRYREPFVDEFSASSALSWAEHSLGAITKMKLDGILT